MRVGVGAGDKVFFVNSLPREERSEAAMEELVRRVEGLGLGVGVGTLWLDPRRGFEEGVAGLRRLPEGCGGCEAVYLAVGGLRWLVLAAAFAALVLGSVGRLRGVEGVRLVLSLEESPAILSMLPDPGQRVIEIPVYSGIVPEVDEKDLAILEAVARGARTARDVHRVVGGSERNVYRRLEKLRRLGLLEVVDRRSGRLFYGLTVLGRMLV